MQVRFVNSDVNDYQCSHCGRGIRPFVFYMEVTEGNGFPLQSLDTQCFTHLHGNKWFTEME